MVNAESYDVGCRQNGWMAMEDSHRLVLLNSDGTPLDSRIARVLTGLLPRLRHHFPQLRDDVALTEVLERAGRRITFRERHAGRIEKLHGYAWVTIRSVATSEMRRSSVHVMRKTLESEASRARLASVPAAFGTAEEVERNVLLREVLAKLSQEERLVCVWKKAGYSSQEVAKYLGRSVAAVDTMFSRAKQKLRRALGTSGDHRQLVTHADERREPRLLGEEGAETDDGTTRSAQ